MSCDLAYIFFPLRWISATEFKVRELCNVDVLLSTRLNESFGFGHYLKEEVAVLGIKSYPKFLTNYKA